MKVAGALGVKPPGPDFLLIIPVIMPSLNKQLRMHWRTRGRLKNNAILHVRAVMGRDEIKHLKKLAHLTIRVYSNAPKLAGGRARSLDVDNLVGAQKPLVDALKDLGIIKNDSPVWLDIGYVERREKVERPRTEIEITYNAISPGNGETNNKEVH